MGSLTKTQLKVALIETYRANSTLLKLEHFVSMAIVYMGICSRLYNLCHAWVNQIEECYHLLYNWSQCFPSGFKQKDEKVFLLSNNLDCQANTVRLARVKYAQDTMKSKYSNQHKIHLETSMANPVVVDKIQEIKKECGIDDDDLMDFEDLGGNINKYVYENKSINVFFVFRGYSSINKCFFILIYTFNDQS